MIRIVIFVENLGYMGIICLETEWEHTGAKNRLALHTEPLLQFICKACGCKYIYRRVATKSELVFYLSKFRTQKYSSYSIFYLSFHGNTHTIQLEGEKGVNKAVSLNELSTLANGCFKDRHIHFSSCRTMLGSEKELLKFKEETSAKSISGYTKSVDYLLSAINDIAYFDQILRHPYRFDFAGNNMLKYYEGLGRELGFKII